SHNLCPSLPLSLSLSLSASLSPSLSLCLTWDLCFSRSFTSRSMSFCRLLVSSCSRFSRSSLLLLSSSSACLRCSFSRSSTHKHTPIMHPDTHAITHTHRQSHTHTHTHTPLYT